MLPAPDTRRVAFGASLRDVKLNSQAANIRTFSEERGTEDDKLIKLAVQEADQLIFLGCAPHKQNLALIRPQQNKLGRCFGTCYLPPPEDRHAKPSMESFAAPTGASFGVAIRSWPRPQSLLGMFEDQTIFEPLTSLQFVAKHGIQWIA
jgi:hypothetical protein